MSEHSSEYVLDEQIDKMIASDEALHHALSSDNPLLRVGARLASNAHPVISPIARASLLDQLLNIQVVSAPVLLHPRFTGWVARIAASVIAVIAIGLASQPASASSLPGDWLYPVKLQWEQVALNTARTPQREAVVRVNLAQERLDELEQLPAESPLREDNWERIAEQVEAVNTLASSNDLFAEDVVLAQQVLSVVLRVEASNDGFATIVPNIETSRQLLGAEITPLEADDQQVTVEITPEVTDVVPEATSEILEVLPAVSDEIVDDTTSETDDFISYTLYVRPDMRVNVRQGAGTDFAIVGSANQNTPVTVIGEAAGWYQVELPNGLVGWIFVDGLDRTSGRSDNDSSGMNNQTQTGNANGNANGNSNGNQNGNANDRGNQNGNSNGNANGRSNG